MIDAPDKSTHAAKRREESREGLRLKLRGFQYIRRLHEIAAKAEGSAKEDVPALQLKANIYFRLLAKCLPDLKAIEHSGEVNHRHATEIPDDELGDIATGSSNRATETPPSAKKPGAVH